MVGWPEILIKGNQTKEERKCICNHLLTTESHMEQLILKHFTEEDFKKVWMRKIGGGVIGGKACGLLGLRPAGSQEINRYTYAGIRTAY